MSEQDPAEIQPDRPDFPPGYGLAQSTEGLLPWDFIDSRMEQARNYWLGTVAPHSRPHVTPVWGVWADRKFYFATDPASRKAHNLAKNQHAVVHLESGDEVVILEGLVCQMLDPDRAVRLDALYRAKYDVQLAGNLIQEFTPETVFAWKEANFPVTATRWTLNEYEHE